jgi:hypothetical protein
VMNDTDVPPCRLVRPALSRNLFLAAHHIIVM